ncbi:ATP-binding protein [Streptomyces sp. NPDC127038]|uniref:ATP-binding protein n=1 Tax=Streptomyces sp. NPDC127038 TaxID=3347114 RepID=UPI0036464F88
MDRSSEDTGDGRAEVALSMEASLSVDVNGSRIAQARHLAASFLSTVRDTHSIPVATSAVEIVQLIVSELVTNARKYAPGPALLQMQVTGNALRIELWDSNPLPPAVKAHDPGRIGQHGLEIVTALAQSVSIEATPPGKRIIATVMLNAR